MATRSSITGSVPMGSSRNQAKAKEGAPLIQPTASQTKMKQEEEEKRIKKLFILTLSFKVSALVINACILAFAAESTPNIDIFDCNYDHRPGFVAFFMVVHCFYFIVLVFLLCYQLFYQLKEKAMVPQRMMDLMAMIALIILTAIALACYALWMDDTLGPYLGYCDEHPLPKKDCVTSQTCSMFKSMKTMAVGCLFWAALLLILNVLFTSFLGYVVAKRLMQHPEGRVLYKKMQEDSKLDVQKNGANNNAANNNFDEEVTDKMKEDDELGYGGKGLVLLQFPRSPSETR